MPKQIFLLLFTVISTIALSQSKENYIKDNVFHTNLKSGAGEIIPVIFKLASDFEVLIVETELYKKWENETFTNPANAKYVEKWKNQTHLETYLMGKTNMASLYAQLDLKNSNSFTPIKDSEGFIYLNDKAELKISFPFKAQNGYGNMIISKAYYSESIKDGKIESKHFISTN